MLYPLSNQATWIDGQLRVRNIVLPDDSEYISEYDIYYICNIIYVNCDKQK